MIQTEQYPEFDTSIAKEFGFTDTSNTLDFLGVPLFEADSIFNILIRFGFNLNFQLLLTQTTRQRNALGDDGGRRQRQSDMLRPGTAFLDETAKRLGHLIEFFNVPVRDPAAFELFHGASFENERARLITTQLHELDAGRADVNPEHRGRLPTK